MPSAGVMSCGLPGLVALRSTEMEVCRVGGVGQIFAGVDEYVAMGQGRLACECAEKRDVLRLAGVAQHRDGGLQGTCMGRAVVVT